MDRGLRSGQIKRKQQNINHRSKAICNFDFSLADTFHSSMSTKAGQNELFKTQGRTVVLCQVVILQVGGAPLSIRKTTPDKGVRPSRWGFPEIHTGHTAKRPTALVAPCRPQHPERSVFHLAAGCHRTRDICPPGQ
jgi:hypothetical protein